jgi:hypothetical protein
VTERPHGFLKQQLHAADVAQTLSRILLQAASQQSLLRGNALQIRLLVHDLREDIEVRLAVEQSIAGDHLVEHRTEGPDEPRRVPGVSGTWDSSNHMEGWSKS